MSKVLHSQCTIGIIGGMSWESTQTYYQLINQGVKRELGGLHSADILLHSLDFAQVADLQAEDDWPAMAALLIDSGLRLKAAGAQGILIATNTMHKVADEVQAATRLPLIHIADATAAAIKAAGLSKIALLGTNFTMTQDFYRQRLVEAGLTVMVPEESERNEVHRIIYKELCQGQFTEKSRQRYIEIIAQLAEQGAEGVILGCTEIGLLIKQADSPIPVFDTTQIHAEAAVEFLLRANNQSL
ncbi:aspartate/glutamate racemase family protein [Psychrobacter arenosus]|uniref:aspartate/glutamate racemase family protein n=1 Tax=Psychrobacter arenosus TaxID=256326 RepID=UPI001918F538|nr:aspartate/glutamate racemase family protein [Psychrobacter arenosus]